MTRGRRPASTEDDKWLSVVNTQSKPWLTHAAQIESSQSVRESRRRLPACWWALRRHLKEQYEDQCVHPSRCFPRAQDDHARKARERLRSLRTVQGLTTFVLQIPTEKPTSRSMEICFPIHEGSTRDTSLREKTQFLVDKLARGRRLRPWAQPPSEDTSRRRTQQRGTVEDDTLESLVSVVHCCSSEYKERSRFLDCRSHQSQIRFRLILTRASVGCDHETMARVFSLARKPPFACDSSMLSQ